MSKRCSIFSVAGLLLAISFCLGSDSPTFSGAAVGQPAPQFTLENQDGVKVSLATFGGKIVVLEWTNPDCPFVQAHYQKHTMINLAAKYKPQGVEWLAINSSHYITNAASKDWATQQNIPYPILNDASGTTGHAYGATNTPDMYIIGKDGTLLYRGAIDNNRDGDKAQPMNYVDRALGEILGGKPVSIPMTTPYGCTVKYAGE
jgi:peroxiredoxin